MVTRCASTGPFYRYHHVMPTPDWYNPKLFRRKKTPFQQGDISARPKLKRFRLVSRQNSPFKLNRLCVFTLVYLAIFIAVLIFKKL